MGQGNAAGQNQDQHAASGRSLRAGLQVDTGRTPRPQLYRAMQIGLSAGKTEHTIPVVLQVRRMGSEGATGCR